MAWTSGTATDYRDLLRKLRIFVTSTMTPASQRWQQLRWVEQPTTQELILKGPGLAGADEIFVGIQTYQDADAGWYWWDLNGFAGYNAAQPFNAQPGAITSDHPALSLWDSAIAYWFFANGRRIVVVAKVGTQFECAYAGFILPWTTPGQWAYPLFIGGSQTAAGGRLRSRADDGHRAFWHPRIDWPLGVVDAAAMLWSTAGWVRISNSPEANVDDCKVWPYLIGNLHEFGQCVSGDACLLPVALLASFAAESSRVPFGELDGVFYVSGHNTGAEAVITHGGRSFLVIQNVFRTAFDEHAAIELV